MSRCYTWEQETNCFETGGLRSATKQI